MANEDCQADVVISVVRSRGKFCRGEHATGDKEAPPDVMVEQAEDGRPATNFEVVWEESHRLTAPCGEICS